ncbi:ATP-binding protein [Streptomyces rhizosphaerihabitans]|uniref:ATP-binding protein n=1 Tax=Streptomyces rhizosphaerihabitans TaxID=1266770 RepID=UPI0021C004E6|nr:AAA family ATPase [Streptomyces rhizosphaerihabitans]MCT9007764.1 AAA family ATPase [Streptomyces rhizosphaerihabitans]
MVTGFPFVGREDVLGELREAGERAVAGRGGLVTLTGAAGAGKTRLAEEAVARAEGFRAVWTWCPPDAVEHALRPWSRLLRELVVDDVHCGRPVAASPSLRALLAGSAAGEGTDTSRDADPEGAWLGLAGDVAEVLTTVARQRPLLLVLDDVHAADASSLRLLLETSDAVRGARVLLLATARDDDTAWHDRAWARAQLLRRGRALPVGPLREKDVAALLNAATGDAPAPSAVRALARYTGGDAFFVTELLRTGGGLDGPASDVPATAVSVRVRDAVRARTAELSPSAAQLLDIASLLGTRFRLDVLADSAAVPLDEVRALLGEAAGAGLLAEAGANEGRFRHDLLREALSGRPAPGERARLHHTVAAVLADHTRRGRDTGPAEVAHHLLLAGPEHAREAAGYCREAADRAAGLLAFEEAARWYERAAQAYGMGGVEAAKEAGGSAGARAGVSVGVGRAPGAVVDGGETADQGLGDAEERVEVLLGLGAARLGSGDWTAARSALLRAASLARRAGRPDLLARAVLGLGTGPVGFEVDVADREQVDLLGEARSSLAGDPAHAALRAAVTARLSLAAALLEPEGHRVALAKEAVSTARGVDDPAALGPALAALCDARPGPDHCRDRLDWSQEIIAVARSRRDLALELLGRRLRLVALMETGSFAEADAQAAAYEMAARPLRQPLYAWYVPLWRGTRALMEGRYDDCAAALDEVEALGGAAGSANATLLAETQRWCLYAETGDRDSLQRLRDRAPLERMPGVWPRVTLGLLAAQLGRREDASRRLTAAMPSLVRAPRDSEWLPMMAQAAETVGAVGTHPSASLLYDALAPYAGLFVVEGIGAAIRGPVDRQLALLARSVGDDRTARHHRDRAVRAALEAGAVALAERIAEETVGTTGTSRMTGTAGTAETSGTAGTAGTAGTQNIQESGTGTAVPAPSAFRGGTVRARDGTSDSAPIPVSADARPHAPARPIDAGLQDPARPTAVRPDAPARRPGSPLPAPLFRREGPLWHLVYAGREARLPDSKGLRDIAVLLGRPGTPVPAVDLAMPGTTAAGGTGTADMHPVGDLGEVIDAPARAAYRRRLRELEEKAEDADAGGDAVRSRRIAEEKDALVRQLSAAYGIGGHVRRAGSPVERARTAVTARVRAAVRRVAAVHPELGRHLESAVRTGTLCVYEPENPPAWRL